MTRIGISGRVRGLIAVAWFGAAFSGFWPALTPFACAADAKDNILVKEGERIFRTVGGVGCASCHGPYAEGDIGIGPNNRGFGEAKIRTALQSVKQMAFLQEPMTEPNIKAVAAYFNFIGNLQLLKTLVRRSQFIPDRFEVRPGTGIQLAIKNGNSQPRTFSSDKMGIGDLPIAGRENGDIVWKAPDTEGEFELRCKDCGQGGEKLLVVVSKSAKPFIPSSEPAAAKTGAATATSPARPGNQK